MRILFILKKHHISGGYTSPGRSSGLFNSAQFVCDMLHNELGHDTKLVVVHDNNCIDREVTKFRPDVVIIEALWVIPQKFEVLHKQHPDVIWIVRNHSALPFLAHEGSAINWLLHYPNYKNVFVGCNDQDTQEEFELLQTIRDNDKEVFYLPNFYPTCFHARRRGPGARQLDIGCFGAVRPLKNQLIQAVAAINYAESESAHLNFHINGTRIEGGGESIRKNLRSLFKFTPHTTLVEHGWLSRDEFIRVVRRMDAGLQCSYTETFNIVAADFVMNDIPLVGSSEIEWLDCSAKADPNDSDDIACTLNNTIIRAKEYPHYNPSRDRLVCFSQQSIMHWGQALADIACG